MSRQKKLLHVAITAHQKGRLTEAEKTYLEILNDLPKDSQILYLLSIINFQKAEFIKAERFVLQAIEVDPTVVDYYSNLGRIFRVQGKLLQATNAYKQALKIDDQDAQIHSDLAAVLIEGGRYIRAEYAARNAVRIAQTSSFANLNLGLAQLGNGNIKSAILSFEAATNGDPKIAEAHFQYAECLYEMDDFELAALEYKKAIKLQPKMIEAHCNLGNSLRSLGLFEGALKSYSKALEIDPSRAEVYSNQGIAFHENGNRVEGIDSYRKALKIKPDDPETHRNLGMALLQGGDFKEGWKELEWRWRTKSFKSIRRDLGKPRWRGESLKNKTILVTAEQGLGDSIQFSRYIERLGLLGGRVLLETQGPILNLLSLVKGVSESIEINAELPTFDFYIPIMSLPGEFNENLSDSNLGKAYIKLNDTDIKYWESRLSSVSGKMNIGLVWRGSERHPRDKWRSPGLGVMRPLLEEVNATFFSLQKNDSRNDIKHFDLCNSIIDLEAELETFSETAAISSLMNLVITPDTAVAHLCGAIGTPVWVLLPYTAEWRWLEKIERTPWYESVRLIRQPSFDDWDSVINQVISDLNLSN